MAQDQPTPSKGANDIDSIRSILFGDQVSQIDVRFETLEKAIDSLRSENRSLRQALETELTMRENGDGELERKIDILQNENRNLRQALETELTMRENADRELEHKIDTLHNKSQTEQKKLLQSLRQALEEYQKKLDSSSA
jgi:predicted RNase H-like nuclease (RuvC/YqgF family)